MKIKQIVLMVSDADFTGDGYQESMNRIMGALRPLPEAQCATIDIMIDDSYNMVRAEQKVIIDFIGEPMDPSKYLMTANRCPTADRHDPHQGHSWIMNDIAYWCVGYSDNPEDLLRPQQALGGTDDHIDASPRGSDPKTR